jgi:hypothetical protein
MSSSKSGSGSLSSLLPKKFELIHVILALVLGLMLCSMMGKSVEGWTQAEAATFGFCESNLGIGEQGCYPSAEDASAESRGYCATYNDQAEICNMTQEAREEVDTQNSLPEKGYPTADGLCEFGVGDDPCIARDQASCNSQAGLDAGCEYVDCAFTGVNPFSSDIASPLDMAVIREWEKCLATKIDGSGAGNYEGEIFNVDDNSDLANLASDVRFNQAGTPATTSDEEGGFLFAWQQGDGKLINLDVNGYVVASPDYFPDSWATSINSRAKLCVEDDDGNRIVDTDGNQIEPQIGWNNSISNFSCLNYNPNKRTLTYQIDKLTPMTGPGCTNSVTGADQEPGTRCEAKCLDEQGHPYIPSYQRIQQDLTTREECGAFDGVIQSIIGKPLAEGEALLQKAGTNGIGLIAKLLK